MNDLVAATLVSGPACSSMTSCASAVSGESATFTSATTKAPDSRAASAMASRSGLAPDWEISRHRLSSSRRRDRYTDTTDGPEDEVTRPVRVSSRYLA